MSNYKPAHCALLGFEKQNWVAFSLFMQFLRDQDFAYIDLEPKQSEDFDLVFNNGKKIICEAKYRKNNFSYSALKELLKKILGKQFLDTEDRILIICRNVDQDFVSKVKNAKFFDKLKKWFKTKSFTGEEISLLPKVDFWLLPDGIKDASCALLSELMEMWLPREDIERFTSDIILNKIFSGSAKGAIYSRLDFLQEINKFKEEVIGRSDYLNKKQDTQKKYEFYISIPQKPYNKLGTGTKAALSQDWYGASLVLENIKMKKKDNESDIDLKQYDYLWSSLGRVGYFILTIVDIFRQNLHTEVNRKYVLDYIKKTIKLPRSFYREDFLISGIVKILAVIMNCVNGESYVCNIVDIIQKLVSTNDSSFFYLSSKNSDRNNIIFEKEEMCNLLERIYKDADDNLRKKIVKLLTEHFNIIEDCGAYNYSPKQVFAILNSWLSEDLAERFEYIIRTIAEQHDKFYYKKFCKKKGEFKGWELCGHSYGVWGDNYYISDQHYVVSILRPAIDAYYKKNPSKGWQFIIEKCISKEQEVTRNRPDFLNRTVCEIVIERYASDDVKIADEAFAILQEFIKSLKGIPNKASLIYQAVTKGEARLSNENKWRLVEITLSKYGLPIDVFVDQIVVTLANNGFEKAKNEIKKWFSNPEYLRSEFLRGGMPEQNLTNLISAFRESDFIFACDLFKQLLGNENFKKGSVVVNPIALAEVLRFIINKDYSQGLGIIRDLEKEQTLNHCQQQIYCLSLFNYGGNDDSDDVDFLMKVYHDVVDRFLATQGNNIANICKRIPDIEARMGFARFAVRLATKKKVSEALRIIEVFINDPDPEDESEVLLGGERPSFISSVRDYCSWALSKCCILAGRNYIEKIIALTKQLINDEKYCVIHMGCYPLSQIAKNRLSVLPNDKNTLFFNDNMGLALKMAKDVEKIAFDLLERFAKWDKPIQQAMAGNVFHTFDGIRALNERDALHLLNIITSLPVEIAVEAADLLVYFAELRKDRYTNWQFKLPGLYDDLNPEQYDAGKFRKILHDAIERTQKESPEKCFKYAAAFEYMVRESSLGSDQFGCSIGTIFKYFNLLTNVYSRDVFNLVYSLVENKLFSEDSATIKYYSKWYDLFVKCLKVEKKYYENEIGKDDTGRMCWYSSLHTPKILNRIMDNDKFIKAAFVFFFFPKEMVLHETEELVERVIEISQVADEQCASDAKKIIQRLKEQPRYMSYQKLMQLRDN